ncbi:MAG: TIGR03085 family protein [Sporichthyaceae bacterium]|nr:TIGR03085 family protein [Sporichthyaceae bacterium]
MSIARWERRALADLMSELGPEAPTLCAGWDTRALAAHLVVRERRPDTTAGVAVSALAGWTERVRKQYERRPYADLVRLVRTGPGWLSPLSLPGLDGIVNTTEFAVHHEDVRRAQPGWTPRELPGTVQDALWKTVRTVAPMSLRSLQVGVVLRRPDSPRSTSSTDSTDAAQTAPAGRTRSVITVKDAEPSVTITGEPMEVLLFLFGRRDHALVEITGDAQACAELTAAPLKA